MTYTTLFDTDQSDNIQNVTFVDTSTSNIRVFVSLLRGPLILVTLYAYANDAPLPSYVM